MMQQIHPAFVAFLVLAFICARIGWMWSAQRRADAECRERGHDWFDLSEIDPRLSGLCCGNCGRRPY